MPTNRTSVKRSRVSEPISGIVYYLYHGELAEDETDRFLNHRQDAIKAAWETEKDKLLQDYIAEHPSKRPWGWWQWSAPRWDDPYTDCWYHNTLQEPRQRIGGTGSPSYECMGNAPEFSFGLPVQWPKDIDVELGLAKESDLIDPANPPTFESQAAYLQRHGLLTSDETKWLAKHPAAGNFSSTFNKFS